MEIHRILGEKVSVYRRDNSSRWQCSCSLKGRQYRSSKPESLTSAKDIAEDWYMELGNKDRFGELSSGKTFREAAKKFEIEGVVFYGEKPAVVSSEKSRLVACIDRGLEADEIKAELKKVI